MKATDWISVKNKIPDKKGEFLVTDGQSIYIAWDCRVQQNGTLSCEYSRCCGCECRGMTHWMPLPELPRRTNNAVD